MVSVPPRQDEQEMEVPESWYALKMGHLHCAGQSPLTRHDGVRGDKAAEFCWEVRFTIPIALEQVVRA